MTTKSLLKKQIIVPMKSNNSKKVIVKANAYVSNINRLFKRVKFEISIDFIWSDNKGVRVQDSGL